MSISPTKPTNFSITYQTKNNLWFSAYIEPRYHIALDNEYCGHFIGLDFAPGLRMCFASVASIVIARLILILPSSINMIFLQSYTDAVDLVTPPADSSNPSPTNASKSTQVNPDLQRARDLVQLHNETKKKHASSRQGMEGDLKRVQGDVDRVLLEMNEHRF